MSIHFVLSFHSLMNRVMVSLVPVISIFVGMIDQEEARCLISLCMSIHFVSRRIAGEAELVELSPMNKRD